MCGRFLLRCPPDNWPSDLLGDSDYGVVFNLPASSAFETRSNISPTQSVLSIVQASAGESRTIQTFRWGLVPRWADDVKIGASMINARSETVELKPSFRHAFAQRRCLIPADGYYEWVKVEDKKQAMLIQRPGQELFCFAGLWERNEKISSRTGEESATHEPLVTCTIITTAANQSMISLHDRMPVVIRPGDYRRWLDPNYRDVAALKSLLAAADEGFFVSKPVGKVSGS